MTFGDRLIELRKSRGFTREAFADYLGISKYTLRNYELSVNDPGSTFLKQISNIFNVSIDYLLCLTNEKEKTSSYQLKSTEYDHIKKYRALDSHGKEMVDFTLEKEWERTTNDDKIVAMPDHLEVKAAHERTDIEVTEEMRKHDDNIMNDDSEWE